MTKVVKKPTYYYHLKDKNKYLHVNVRILFQIEGVAVDNNKYHISTENKSKQIH